jgi:hypothetical protein
MLDTRCKRYILAMSVSYYGNLRVANHDILWLNKQFSKGLLVGTDRQTKLSFRRWLPGQTSMFIRNGASPINRPPLGYILVYYTLQ